MPSWWSKLLKPRRFGLRTEIIVNLLLIMGAALLFSGFLLLRLFESELLAERLTFLRTEMQVLGALIPGETGMKSDGEPARRFLNAVGELGEDALFLFDSQLNLVSSIGRDPQSKPQLSELQRARLERGVVESTVFPATGLFSSDAPGYVWLTTPLTQREEISGFLQGRFSLSGITERLRKVRQVFLLYVILFGGVLFLFGLWLLSNAIVRPIRSLRLATRQVAAGDLEPTLVSAGPREITELGDDFNRMTVALRHNRQQLQEQIATLERMNTELQQTQNDLVRSEKLASVGRLAAGMAHEIGNPLGAVIGYLALLKSEATTTRDADISARALAEAERIDRLVRDLLDYAAPGRNEPEVVDPVVVIRDAYELLSHQGAFEEVRLVMAIPQILPFVEIARHKLLQVLVNLLLNARDATPHGTVDLSAGEDMGEVWIAVADDGTGMDEETRQQIFDPFFTTKAPGRGCGLGLSVCLRIVEEAGGRMEVESRLGKGSVFRLCLPRMVS